MFIFKQKYGKENVIMVEGINGKNFLKGICLLPALVCGYIYILSSNNTFVISFKEKYNI